MAKTSVSHGYGGFYFAPPETILPIKQYFQAPGLLCPGMLSGTDRIDSHTENTTFEACTALRPCRRTGRRAAAPKTAHPRPCRRAEHWAAALKTTHPRPGRQAERRSRQHRLVRRTPCTPVSLRRLRLRSHRRASAVDLHGRGFVFHAFYRKWQCRGIMRCPNGTGQSWICKKASRVMRRILFRLPTHQKPLWV